MHMAVTGTYQLSWLGACVLRAQAEGQAVVPNRDVIQFPVADSTRIALQTNANDIGYIMSKQKGTMDDLFSESGVNEYWFDTLLKGGMVGIKMTSGMSPSMELMPSTTWRAAGYGATTTLRSTSSPTRKRKADGVPGTACSARPLLSTLVTLLAKTLVERHGQGVLAKPMVMLRDVLDEFACPSIRYKS